MWNNFYIAMPHASQEVEDENIAVDQAYGSGSNQRGPHDRYSHDYGQN